QTLQIGPDSAPLLLGVDHAIHELALQQNNSGAQFHLITITGGPDTCDKLDLVASFNRVSAMVKSAGMEQLWSDFGLLTLHVAAAFTQQGLDFWGKLRNSSVNSE